jgi:hypothetical protein
LNQTYSLFDAPLAPPWVVPRDTFFDALFAALFAPRFVEVFVEVFVAGFAAFLVARLRVAAV